MGPSAAQRRSSKASNITSEDVSDLITKALASFRTEVNNTIDGRSSNLLQQQMEEFRSEMKREFRSYMDEMKQQQPAGTPDLSTKGGSARGSRGIFPTVESVKKESGRFRAVLDQ